MKRKFDALGEREDHYCEHCEDRILMVETIDCMVCPECAVCADRYIMRTDNSDKKNSYVCQKMCGSAISGTLDLHRTQRGVNKKQRTAEENRIINILGLSKLEEDCGMRGCTSSCSPAAAAAWNGTCQAWTAVVG